MYNSLKEYLELLDREGELIRVGVAVDPVLEMAEITDRMVKSPGGGKAILFENTGTPFPVAVNLFGSDRRMALALGVDNVGEIPARINGLVSKALSPKGSLAEKLAAVPMLAELSRWFPKRSRGRGECQQVIFKGEEASLDMLPILKCWPHDGGRFVTLPMVNTVDPDTGAHNAGMYRMQVMDSHSTGMHWHMHKTGARHYEAYKRAGLKMPVSVCLGGDPAYTYSSIAPLPDGIDEHLLAGFLRRKPVKLVQCITNDLYVPSDCDFVIEGYVDPAEEKVVEGPFGDHTGFYSLEDLYPVFHITAITHRRDAVWPATIVGIPPQEDLYISKATEKIFLAPIRLLMQPELKDMYMPAAGVSHNLVIVSASLRYPGQADKLVQSMWGAGQMMFNKMIVVTPEDTDVRDPHALAALLRDADMEKSVMRGKGVLDVLDHATPTIGYGGKLGLDLSGCDPRRTPQFTAPESMVPAGGITRWDLSFLAEWGIIIMYAGAGEDISPQSFIAENKLAAKIAVVADNEAHGLTGVELLWLATGNTEPSRDAEIYEGVLIADARTKLPGRRGNPVRFPNVVTSSEETIALVDRRWAEYGLGEFIGSPSKHYLPLVKSDKAEI